MKSLNAHLERALLSAPPPRWGLQRLAEGLTPSATSIVTAAVSLTLALPVFTFCAFLWFTTAGDAHGFQPFMVALFVFIGAIPVGFGLALASLFAGRPLARTMMMLLATLVLIVGTVSCGVSAEFGPENPDHPREAGQGFMVGVVTTSPPALFALFLTGVFGLLTPVQLRRELDGERQRRALGILNKLGSVGLQELSQALGTDVDGTIEQLERPKGKLALRIDPALDRVTTASRAGRRNALLLAEIERSGTATLNALAEATREPVPVVEHWTQELIDSGTLDAEIIQNEVIFRASRPFQACGGCGGPVNAVGGAIGRCAHCGTEAYG